MIGNILAAAAGRFSLAFVVYASLAFLCLVCLMFASMIVLRLYHQTLHRYREARRKLYRSAVGKVLADAPLAEVVEAFRPKRWGDASIAQDVMIDAMRHLTGPPFELLSRAAQRLDVIERNLNWLRSRNKHRRGQAMEALGLMRTPQAVVGIIDILENEPLDMKLVALRALASIGDPHVLPYFVRISDELPPPMMPRLVSLMLEFGRAGHDKISEIINRHPECFSPRVLAELMREISADLEAPA